MAVVADNEAGGGGGGIFHGVAGGVNEMGIQERRPLKLRKERILGFGFNGGGGGEGEGGDDGGELEFLLPRRE